MSIVRRFLNCKLNFIFIPTVSFILLFFPHIFGFIGLSSIGPISGGLFSTMQGSGIVSGSLMAMTQSFVMSGWATTVQLFTMGFWIIVSLFTFVKNIYFMIHNR